MVYLQGSCTWRVAGFRVKENSPNFTIDEGQSGAVITCEVGNNVLLTTEVVLFGKQFLPA